MVDRDARRRWAWLAVLAAVAIVITVALLAMAQPGARESTKRSVGGESGHAAGVKGQAGRGRTVLWSADMENGTLSEWTHGRGGGSFDSGGARTVASRAQAHTGSWSAKASLARGSGAAQLFRWAESRKTREAFYSAWFYFDRRFKVTGSYFNLMKFKSHDVGSKNDPFWILDINDAVAGEPRFGLIWWPPRIEGPHRGQRGSRYYSSVVSVPIKRWFNITVQLRESTDFDGVIRVWRDGREVVSRQNIRTSYSNCSESPSCVSSDWSLNLDSDGLDPSASLYIDDVQISSAAQGSGPKKYYVDCARGADDNEGTSADDAWRSLDRVNRTRYQPGDRVNLRRGCRWTGTLVAGSSGTKVAPITYSAYGTGRRPTISRSGPGTSAVRVTGDYNVIEGLLVRDAAVSGILITARADRNVVRDIEALHTGTGVMVDGQHNLVTRSYVHDLKMILVSDAPDDDYGAVCFWLAGPDNEVSYNRGVNCSAPSIDYGHDGGFVEIWQRGDRSYVHHNQAEGTRGFLEVGSNKGGSARDVRIAYNVIVNSRGLCLQIGGHFAIPVSNLRFENNTVLSDGLFLRCLHGTPAPTTLALRNNIFLGASPISENDSLTHEHNLYSAPPGYTLGPGELLTDPQLVDPARGRFGLQGGSPAIDAGIDLGYHRDFANQAVPAGPAPDIGAFEYPQASSG